MAIKVMSSCCGCDPAKFRTSSMTRVTIAAGALHGAGADRLDHAFQPKFDPLAIQRFSYAVRVKNQAIVAFERDVEVAL